MSMYHTYKPEKYILELGVTSVSCGFVSMLHELRGLTADRLYMTCRGGGRRAQPTLASTIRATSCHRPDPDATGDLSTHATPSPISPTRRHTRRQRPASFPPVNRVNDTRFLLVKSYSGVSSCNYADALDLGKAFNYLYNTMQM